ncbi:hypothetical protein ACLK15_14945 [Escherichia coli]
MEPSEFVQTFSRRNGGEATSGFFEVPKNETKGNGIVFPSVKRHWVM